MRLGVAGPADLMTLAAHVDSRRPVTRGLSSPIVAALVLEAVRRGHEVSVFTLSPDPRDWGEYRGGGLLVRVGPYRQRGRWVDAFRAERRALLAMMRGIDVDVVHAHWTYEFAIAALRSGNPTVVTARDWGPTVLAHHRHPYRVVRLGMQALVLKTAPHLTANSPYLAEKIERWYRREVAVIPNGIAMGTAPRERPRRDAFVIGALNNGFGSLKNVSALLKAFALVRRQRRDVVLRLAGNDYGPGERCESWATRRGLDAGVEFVGSIPYRDVPAFLRRLDLFVHPSLEESFGSVLLEALREGTPVIGGAQSGAVPWVLGDGAAGRLVDVRSPEAIATTILEVAADPEYREKMAAIGRRHVERNFSLSRVFDLYERVYERALTLRSRRLT